MGRARRSEPDWRNEGAYLNRYVSDPAAAHGRQLKGLGVCGEDSFRRDLVKIEAQHEVLGYFHRVPYGTDFLKPPTFAYPDRDLLC